MVEPRMDRDRRRAESYSGTGEQRLLRGSPPQSPQSGGWDPYQVWHQQVKQARDLAALRSRNPGPLKVNHVAPASDKLFAARWRMRLAALLPRSGG